MLTYKAPRVTCQSRNSAEIWNRADVHVLSQVQSYETTRRLSFVLTAIQKHRY